ncbi:MAG TPA: DNA alkylation repair protein [Aquabacterium sp.]|uniref:DNA alkylation repair protein n=1 Tax=Aquabacterium sp. TaxID=1872578 RepID=UPI002E3721E9|nr:DNA alkylation repair protein [Aquabacterium sp.]HEX5356916.1 DNA alkylation repair protein [Aquabacterium sp.]
MEPFKNLLNAEVVSQTGHHLQRISPLFDRAAFEQGAKQGLDELEFKDRAVHICKALHASLPNRFDQAADILQASLKPVASPQAHHDPDKELGTLKTDDTGVAGWVLWAYGEYVARHGLQHPERALQTLHALTQRFTAEFAIRPFIVEHPALTFATLHQWAHDPSAHVRRLVSEGSRPRLPWGLRLQALVRDPSPTLPLLLQLQDDPSEYVRRSVANHLNDIAKDHPDVLVRWLEQHLPDAPSHRVKLLRHACRSLIKQAHPGVMSAWGLGEAFKGRVTVSLGQDSIAVGDSLTLEVRLKAAGKTPQTLELDYRIHHLKANGETSPKTFKGKRLTLQPGEELVWRKAHSFKPVSTRRYHPGRHAVDIQINGQLHGQASFTLVT